MTELPLALVTGASRGLGAALALELSATHHIVAVARTTGSLEALDDRIQAAGGSATLAPMDITNADAMATLCRSLFDRWGKLALWVHTAIYPASLAPVTSPDPKDITRSIDTNIAATATLIAYIAPLLGTDGRAVFFDDDKAGHKFFGAYGASKAAQMAFARSWQAETARTGPQVKILAPPPMATPTRGRFHPGEDQSTLVTANDVAKALLPDVLG
ncbi:SDR family NAD(P)-dependent oxidoreductase [Pseudaestuariivita sp.]|uniref:SDR family NAD(P)-dependent oxidoreductase n=1 Tax=Pseudaestuariivita sp. TaxID=2211669 RepID=UPI004057E856